MPTIIERKCKETGNSLSGWLNNEAATLTIPVGAAVTLSATRLDTGARVIDNVAVTIVDISTREVRYDFRDQDLADALAGVTLDLEFAIVPVDNKPTYVPDRDADRLLLTIKKRIAA